MRFLINPSLQETENLNKWFNCKKWLTNKGKITVFADRYGTNQCTVPLLRISFLISCYMFRLNCHHQGADNYITNIYSNFYSCKL